MSKEHSEIYEQYKVAKEINIGMNKRMKKIQQQ